MTKYKRFTGRVFGENATATGDDPQIAQFGSALAGTFIGTTDPETIQQLPAWGRGFIDAVTPETQFPALPEVTGLLKVLSYQICNILQEGVSSWDNTTIYYATNWVSKNGKLYLSKTDENQGNDPETDTTNWVEPLAQKIDINSTVVDSKWVILQNIVYLLEQGSWATDIDYTYSLVDILPKDDFQYEVMISARGTTSANQGETANIYVRTDLCRDNFESRMINKEKTQFTTTAHWGGSLNLVFGKDRQLIIRNTGTGATGDTRIWISGYRRIGTNT